MDVRYCYFRDDHRRPMVTLCRVVQGTCTSYGWAICSPSDGPCKQTGRRIAYERALAAMRPGTAGDGLSKATPGKAGGVLLALDMASGAQVVSWARLVRRPEAQGVAQTSFGPHRETLWGFATRGIAHLPTSMLPAMEVPDAPSQI